MCAVPRASGKSGQSLGNPWRNHGFIKCKRIRNVSLQFITEIIPFQTFNSEKQRLHLTFRPNNLYSKGMYAERTKNTGILLKVKIKRRQNEVITEEVQVLGHSEAVYQFDKLCDYEMSPIMKKTPEATKAELIYDDIVPNLDHTFSSFMEVRA